MADATRPVAAWWAALRGESLPITIAPVAVGTALAATRQAIAWPLALGALVGGILLHLIANLVNTAYDHRHGVDAGADGGQVRILLTGALDEAAVIRVALLLHLPALAVGAWLTAHGGWPIAVIGVAGLLCGWAYSAGPAPLSRWGWAEPWVLFFFGPAAVLGTAWLQIVGTPAAAAIRSPAWWLIAIALGLQATTILAVNYLRDRDADCQAGRRTAPIRWGPGPYRAATVLAYALAAGLLAGAAWWQQSTWLYLPTAIAAIGGHRLARGVARRDGPALQAVLAGTVLLETLTAAALCGALVMETI